MNIIEHAWAWAGRLSKRIGAPRYLIFHHAAAITASAEDVDRWHKGRGWLGIAYHYYVRKDGTIHRGRPEWAVGGHTKGYNRELGICCEGDFTREQMPAAQLRALQALRADLRSRFPGVVDKRHKDLGPTACPGTYFPWAELIAGAVVTPPVVTPPTKPEMPQVALGSGNVAAIAILQRRLNELGIRDNLGRKLAVDGVFGKRTLQAVIRYQKKAHVPVDGIVGPKTWRALGY